MRTCALLGDGGGPAQFRIDLRICLGNRLDDLLRIILVHNVDRLFFAGGIGVIEFGGRRRESQRHCGMRANCRGSQDDKREGEKFWHEAASIGYIGHGRNRFFYAKKKIYNLTYAGCTKGVADLQR